jgi:hypothetical protein
MSHLERYTPEICSQLRQLAESRQWQPWGPSNAQREDLLEDVELTYHLHLAAEASGTRAGMPPMPAFPLSFSDPEGSLDPAQFILHYMRRHPPFPWHQSDNAIRSASACA